MIKNKSTIKQELSELRFSPIQEYQMNPYNYIN